MDLFKLDKYDKYFIAFILVIISLFNIGQCFAYDEETINPSTASNITISPNTNYFTSSDGSNVAYVPIEKGYIYTFHNNSSRDLNMCFSDNIPSLNGVYTYIGVLSANNTYSFRGDNGGYLYFDYQHWGNTSVTRVKIDGQENAVSDLVDNVGVNQLWNVFEGGIDFVGIIVLVAFGLFLVFLLIKKLSKGKADF